MKSQIIHTFKADYFDRIRHKNYLIVLLGMSVLTMLFFPSIDAAYQTLSIGNYRGLYNSAWIGDTLAIMSASTLPLICFYLVKNTINRDRDRGVGELIAATQINKFEYIAGKWFSNLLILVGIALSMLLTAALVQLWHAESMLINPAQLLLPQLAYVLPLLLLIAALPVLFESIPALRAGTGNIIYFFVWAISLIALLYDVLGISTLLSHMVEQASMAGNTDDSGVTVGLTAASGNDYQRFEWRGGEYGLHNLKTWIVMMSLTAACLALSTLCFDRFKQQQLSTSKTQVTWLERRLNRLFAPLSQLFAQLTAYTALTRLTRLEYLLLVKGLSPWWLSVILALLVAQVFAPLDVARTILLPAAWLLCVTILSSLGVRERQCNMQQIVASSAIAKYQQFLAMLIAGALLLLSVSAITVIKLAVLGSGYSFVLLVLGTFFVSAMALMCGKATGTSRTFEILFVACWYLGPVNNVIWLDFIGVTPNASAAAGMHWVFLLSALVLSLIALLTTSVNRR